MDEFTSIEEMAKFLVGEWKTREDFAWGGCADPDADRCALVPIRTAESDSAEQRQFERIRRAMGPFIENGTAGIARMKHWAYGWQEELWLHVYDETGQITPAFRKLWQIYQRRQQSTPSS